MTHLTPVPTISAPPAGGAPRRRSHLAEAPAESLAPHSRGKSGIDAAHEGDLFVSRWPRSRFASAAIHGGATLALAAVIVMAGTSLTRVLALVAPALLGLLVARVAFDALPSPRGVASVPAFSAVIVGAATLAALTLVGAAWLVGTQPSLPLGALAWISGFGMLATAAVVRTIEQAHGKRTRRVFLIGTPLQEHDLAGETRKRSDLTLVGCLNIGAGMPEIQVEAAAEAIARVAPSTLVLSDEAIRDPRLVALASRLNLLGVRVRELRGFYEEEFEKVALSELSPSWFLFDIAGIHDPLFYRAVKRSMETVIAGALLLAALPVLPLIVLGIRLASPGPVFFRQPRAGKDARPMVLTKFRTMHPASDAEHGMWAGEADSRIFPFGRFLRRFRLDEIPQLLHVISGRLSLVGPRPEQPPIVERLEKQMRYYAARHCVRPGLTGWAQVNHGYGGSHEGMLTKLQYDLFYVKRRSLGLDLRILAATVRTVVRGRG